MLSFVKSNIKSIEDLARNLISTLLKMLFSDKSLILHLPVESRGSKMDVKIYMFYNIIRKHFVILCCF